MAGKVSAEMRKAIILIKQGKTRYEAAKISGVHITSITRSKLYQELVKNQVKIKD
jgi:hypothetical protein